VFASAGADGVANSGVSNESPPADLERAQRAGPQHEAPTALVGDDRRLVEPRERALLLGRLAGLEADVVAGQQCVEPGNAGQRDARLDNPELRIVDHETGGVLGDLRLDQYL